ncbi:hypothetical protein QWZ13_09735 [Reinekea marina]|uniref:hypothetical protein n=1 Tax=Reinekea marina TaxID=1310421 RepID=UPI0025B4DFBE|nr:hypothetical protein [Reinekea marina]MDN3649191.1 hypothetical protein [Reinekea marina]
MSTGLSLIVHFHVIGWFVSLVVRLFGCSVRKVVGCFKKNAVNPSMGARRSHPCDLTSF